MRHEIRVEQVASRPLIVVRRRASAQELSNVIPDACGVVWAFVRDRQIKGAGRHVALYWDNVFNLEVGVEVSAPVAVEGDIVRSATPAGTAAAMTHFGPYSSLPGAHQAIHEWCQTQGREIAGPCWEIYGHWADEWNEHPEKIRTDIYYLLKSPQP